MGVPTFPYQAPKESCDLIDSFMPRITFELLFSFFREGVSQPLHTSRLRQGFDGLRRAAREIAKLECCFVFLLLLILKSILIIFFFFWRGIATPPYLMRQGSTLATPDGLNSAYLLHRISLKQ